MLRIAMCCLALLVAISGNAATLRTNDSCDIATMPAATLLLPYFEVDLNSPQSSARTTLFTVINTSADARIARVTLWTDWAFPALTFNVFLTGYDIESLNLYDILGPRGTIIASDCDHPLLTIPQPLLNDVRNALTKGILSSCGAAHVGGTHDNAMGYITIDVVAKCGVTLPNDVNYYNELLYDNVLGGDWMIIDSNPVNGNFAGANPLVHIRAIPSGGPAGVVTQTNLPFTFYGRYTPHQDRDTARMDRRQPLPATFAARFIQGGTGAFNTNFEIWREGVVQGGDSCIAYAKNNGTAMDILDEVRFDEHENPTTIGGGVRISAFQRIYTILPAASSTASSGAIFPPLASSGDVGGWLYLNLKTSGTTRPTQNWIVSMLHAEGRYETAYDATPLGNGCSPTAAVTTTGPEIPIRPAPDVTP